MSEQRFMTSSQLATRNGSSEITWTDQQKRLIATTIAPGCTPDELRLFAYHCQRTGLDPFSKQIYAIKRGGKVTIQAGIDGLRAIAERTGELDGSVTYWCGEDAEWKEVWLGSKPPAAAKTIVHRKGCSHPFIGVARYVDYNAGQGLWSKMGCAMIAKCSEALALRKAFPADLSGLYSSEEMDQADARAVDVTPTAQPAARLQAAPASAPAPVAAPVEEVVDVEPEPTAEPASPAGTEPAPAAAPVAAPAPAVEVSTPAAPVTAAERLAAAVQRLTATGRRALLKAYEAVLPNVTDIDSWLAVCTPQPDPHLAGLTDAAIAALNEGKHPRTGAQLVSKPGRRPAAAAAPEQEIGDDPEQPFAAAS